MKFKKAGKEVFRSKIIHKNLNPVWDERVCLIVDNLQEPLYIKVKGFYSQCLWMLVTIIVYSMNYELMTLMSWFLLVNQKHDGRLV